MVDVMDYMLPISRCSDPLSQGNCSDFSAKPAPKTHGAATARKLRLWMIDMHHIEEALHHKSSTFGCFMAGRRS